MKDEAVDPNKLAVSFGFFHTLAVRINGGSSTYLGFGVHNEEVFARNSGGQLVGVYRLVRILQEQPVDAEVVELFVAPAERTQWTLSAGGIDADSLSAAAEAGKKGDAVMVLLTPERVAP